MYYWVEGDGMSSSYFSKYKSAIIRGLKPRRSLIIKGF